MKQGEKVVLRLAFAAIAALIGLTVYLEMRTQQGGDAKDKFAQLGESVPGPEVWMIPKGVKVADLPDPQSRGAKTMSVYCSQCHDLPVPAMHTAGEWVGVLERMRHRMSAGGGMFARVVTPGEQDWDVLKDYLAAHAQRPMDASRLAGLDGPEGADFTRYCAQCHAPPAPDQHTASEWPRVVLRMKANMTAAGAEVPDDESLTRIVAFLRKQATEAP